MKRKGILNCLSLMLVKLYLLKQMMLDFVNIYVFIFAIQVQSLRNVIWPQDKKSRSEQSF